MHICYCLYICTVSVNPLIHYFILNSYWQQYKHNIIIYIRILNISYELIYIFISFKYNIYLYLVKSTLKLIKKHYLIQI